MRRPQTKFYKFTINSDKPTYHSRGAAAAAAVLRRIPRMRNHICKNRQIILHIPPRHYIMCVCACLVSLVCSYVFPHTLFVHFRASNECVCVRDIKSLAAEHNTTTTHTHKKPPLFCVSAAVETDYSLLPLCFLVGFFHPCATTILSYDDDDNTRAAIL